MSERTQPDKDEPTDIYAARRPGWPGYVAVMVNDPKWAKETAKEIADWVKCGYEIVGLVTRSESVRGMHEYLAEKKRREAERVKMLQTELNEMVDALVAQVDGVQPLPLSQSDDDEEPEEAQLTGREQRALAMADDALEGEETVAPAQERETVPLSTQQPGIYVADGDGPEA